MRTVFTNDMVAHVWAQQSQSEGRSSNGQFYFRDSTIFSYRDSYPIARFVANNGRRAVLFRNDSYSVTTSHHISLAKRAVHGVLVFNVTSGYGGDALLSHDANKADYAARIDAACKAAARARGNAEWRINQAKAVAEEANSYAEFFNLEWRLQVPEFSPEYIAAVKSKAAKDAAAKAKATREREDARRLHLANKASEWLRGDDVSLWDYPDTLLRIKGDEVQTSRGATVPVDHAKRLWPIIQRVMQSGQAYQRNGHSEHVGHFTVDRIEVNGDMRIGCHFIKHNQIARIAEELAIV